MRYLACAIVLLAWPLSAAAQHSFSLPSIVPPLPAITTPLPAIGLPTEWRQRIPWDQPRPPSWEKQQLPPWEQRNVARPRANDNDHKRRRRGNAQVIYVPYPVAYQEPQVIVVQQPPVTRIVHVDVPAPEPDVEEAHEAEPPSPPYVPTGDRTLYVIPGCYVGNVSPLKMKLPDTCDITKLTTYVP